MLQIIGKCLGVTSETVNPPNGGQSFMSTTVHLLTGMRTEQVRVAREFPPADLPKEGEDVVLAVGVRAYSGRNGVGYSLTAFERVKPAQLRAAAGS